MITYLYYYPLVSLILTIIYHLKIQSLNTNKDIFELLNQLNESIESVKNINKSVGEFLEKVINSILDGNKLVGFVFTYAIFLIPIIRWVFIISTLKQKEI